MALKKIGLTGSTGMLGRHLQAALENVGLEVFTVSRNSGSQKASAYWDLTEWLYLEKLDAIFSGVQAVIHAGAMVQTSGNIDSAKMFNANVRACLNLGEWAISRKIPIIYISGAIVYADTLAVAQKENAPLGWNGLGGFYGFSKLLAEDIFLRLQQKGLTLTVVRPSSIYGYGMSDEKMIKRFLAIAETGGKIELTQPVQDQVDLVHAADVSSAVLKMLIENSWGVFNISSGNPISIKDLAEACVKLIGRGSVSIIGDTPQNYKPTIRFSLNTDKARHNLDWQPEIDIHQGMDMILKKSVLAPTPNSFSIKDKV